MVKTAIIIGSGNIANVHIENYVKNGILVLGVFDLDINKSKTLAFKHNILNYFDNIADLLNLHADMASICTPNKFHYEYTMLALKNNYHVLCEKPPSISSLEAKEMYELSLEKNKVLAYNFHHRQDQNVSKIKSMISDFGDVYYVKVQALRRNGIPGWGNFINKDIQGGGPLIDIGIHMLDTALYILDFPKIKKITAKSFQKIGPFKESGKFGSWDKSKYTVEDSLFAFIELENNVLIQLETSFALNIENEVMDIEICGSELGAKVFSSKIFNDIDGELNILYENLNLDILKQEKNILDFINKCNSEFSIICDGKQGFYIQEIVENIYKEANND